MSVPIGAGGRNPNITPEQERMLAEAAGPWAMFDPSRAYSNISRFFFGAPPETTVQTGGSQGAVDGSLTRPVSEEEKAAMGIAPADPMDRYANIDDYEALIRRSLSDPREQAIHDRLSEIAQQRQEQGQVGLDELRQLAEQYQTVDDRMDLSPLLALTDSWTGSNLAPSYQRPMNEKQRLDNAMGLMGALQKAEQGVSEQEAGILAAQLRELTRSKQVESQALQQVARMRERTAGGEVRDEQKLKKDKIDQHEKYRKNYGKKIEDLSNLYQSMDELEKLYRKYGGYLPVNPKNTDFQKAVSLSSQIITSYNTGFAELGALTGPDLGLLENATGTKLSAVENVVRKALGNRGGAGSLRALMKKLDRNAELYIDKAKNIYVDIHDVIDKDAKFYNDSRSLGKLIGRDDPEERALRQNEAAKASRLSDALSLAVED